MPSLTKQTSLSTYVKRVKRLMLLISKLKPHNLKVIGKIIENIFKNDEIAITNQAINGTRIFGIERDILFDTMVTGSFREPHFEEIARLLLKRDYNCLDLGANIGSHTLLLASLCNEGRIYAFEPQSIVFQCLSLNVYLNGMVNVVPINLAVDSQTGKKVGIEEILCSPENINSGYSRIMDSAKLNVCLTVSIDDLKLPKIEFVKMDIQGSELNALKGMPHLIAKDRPYFFFELEDKHLSMRGTNALELLTQFVRLGYVVFRVESNYPADHLAIPIEKREYFETAIHNSKLVGMLTEILI